MLAATNQKDFRHKETIPDDRMSHTAEYYSNLVHPRSVEAVACAMHVDGLG